MPDIPGDNTTTRTITVGGSVTDSLEVVNDHDWFKINLNAGQSIKVFLDGITLVDPYVRIYDSSGNLLYENDDISSGVNRDSLIAFTANYTGTYYIDVGAWVPSPQDAEYPGFTGTYQLSVSAYTPPPLGTVDQLAGQLTDGYWGGDRHHFDVTQGGAITVNLTALTPAGQALARAALASWTDIIGVTFTEVSIGGQITFDDNEEGAFSDGTWSGGIITSAHVNVSTQWLADYGTGLNSYSFQTYIHEIGHALGLGHQGDYNGDARFPYDAAFQNDSWAMSVMSYFSQTDNHYFAGQGFTENMVVTPMLADILAMSTLYGLSTTTRTGDTTYGYNSNAGQLFNANLYPDAAYTVFDSGGNDTLNYSGSAYNQTINLNPETFSNVNGSIGNLTIARGVAIENAIGGSGNDTIIGNAANNVLNGGAGDDTLSYATAAAGVNVNLTTSAQQDTVGAGKDTLSGFERLIGSAFNDTLTGTSTTMEIHGGEGNDRIVSTGAGSHALYGDSGDDWMVAGQGDDWISGGDGFDTVDYSGASGPINAATEVANNNTGNSGFDTMISVERIIGSSFDDTLWAFQSGHEVWGGAGNDVLKGSNWGGGLLNGGVGNDTYELGSVTNQIAEAAGEGIDLVKVTGNFTLGANIENLILLQPVYDPYAGATPNYTRPFADFYGIGNALANLITGNEGANVLSGLGGADILTGGAGADTFRDTAAGLNGDTISDFGLGDKIVISNADFATFSFALSGSTLTFSGGSLTFGNAVTGPIFVSAAAGGGVQLSLVPIDARNDFNGDGRSDILWRSDAGVITNWLGQGNGSFAGNTANAYHNVGLDWQVAGVGDFNGDSRDDVLWRRDNGQVSEWLGQASGGFTSNSAVAHNVGLDWQVAGVGDFNGDGRDDVLWLRDNGQISEWLGQANGSFVSNSAAANQVSLDRQIAGIGDFNGDGRDDILWRRDNGQVSEWLGQANGSFASNSAVANNVGLDWEIAGIGDFNGDGRDDVLWRRDNGQVSEWLGQANGSFASNSAVANNVGLDWNIAGIGDYNGDGRDDVLWRRDNGQLTEWLGQANGSFASNGANATHNVGLDWHIQSPDIFLV